MEYKTSKFLSDVFNAISLSKEIFRKTMNRKVQNKFFIFQIGAWKIPKGFIIRKFQLY